MVEGVGSKERLELGTSITVFIGPEGSGKTTQALKLAEISGKPYISTRKLLENLAENDSGPLGEECRIMFAEHTYLAGETLLKILVEHFSRDEFKDGFIIDGSLRTLEETTDFRKALVEANRNLPLTVAYLVLPREESVKRMKARGRDDDTDESINKRLDKFYYQLSERIYIVENEEGWRLVQIDASPREDEVYKSVVKSLTNSG